MSDLRALLGTVREKHGELTAPLLVDEVRDPNHPHHHIFNWDDTSAAEAHRIDQARALIRRFKVQYREPTATEPGLYVRQYHSVIRQDGGRSYEPVNEIAQDPMAMKILLREMDRDILALRRKYGHLEEFWRSVRSIADESAA